MALSNLATASRQEPVHQPIELTLATSSETISKIYELSDDGHLHKVEGKASGNMSSGTLKRVYFDTLAELPAFIKSLTTNQAIVTGTILHSLKGDVYPVTTVGHPKKGYISRSSDYIVNNGGKRGVLLIDYDVPKDAEPLPIDEILEQFYEFAPVLRECEKVVSASASSYLYRKSDGKCLKGPSGWHIFVTVENAADAQAIGEALFNLSWLAGHGYIHIAKNSVPGKKAACTPRSTLLDKSVFQPTRLSFDSGCECRGDLYQKRPEPLYYPGIALRLDDVKLSHEGLSAVEKMQAEAHEAAANDPRIWLITTPAQKHKEILKNTQKAKIPQKNKKPANEKKITGFGSQSKKERVPVKIREETPVLAGFALHLPHKPYCANNLKYGLRIRPLSLALEREYIQHNGPSMIWTLAFDIDRPVYDENGVGVWEAAGVAPPNFVTTDKTSGRGHLVYYLKAGVCVSGAGHKAPIRYLAAIQNAYTKALGADPHYVGLVTKNPFCLKWQMDEVCGKRYELAELASFVTLEKLPTKPEKANGHSRHVMIFELGRVWAYKAVREHWTPDGYKRWLDAVKRNLDSINDNFKVPLPDCDVGATARSIAKWVWKHMAPDSRQEFIQSTHGSDKQRKRQKASAKKRREASAPKRNMAILMRAQGKSLKTIANELDTPKQTIANWCKVGAYHLPISDDSRGVVVEPECVGESFMVGV